MLQMTWYKRYSLDWPAPFYVLLLAAFPILSLYSHNIKDVNDAGQMVLPLAVCTGGAFLLWILLTLILRNGRKAGLATTLFLAFFFSYGRIYQLLEIWKVFVPRHAYMFSIMLFVWVYSVYFISRAKRDFRTSTTVLNVIAVVLIIINLANIAIYQVNKPILEARSPVSTTGAAVTLPDTGQNLPDIYFIILDEYAHPDTIKEWAGYDDSQFIKSLEDKGFYIAQQSKTRTPHTPQAIAQVVNMEYLTGGFNWDETKKDYTEIKTEPPADPAWSEPTYRKYAYNKAADVLRAKGYNYIYFGNWVGNSRWDGFMKENADLFFNYYQTGGSPLGSEFQNVLWNTTMIKPFYNYLTGNQNQFYFRRGLINTLEHLKEVPSIEGPKFVFAHLMCPHAALVFGPNGEAVDPKNWENFKDKQFYRGQYIFISGEIVKVIDALQKKSKTPPIIVLQSDHGLRPQHPGIVIDGEAWHRILNAMYLPGMDKAVLYESMSPVNTFRLILNRYFNASYELLKDD